MADEKQLTVAELLARNAKDRSGEGKSPRRRRRSLDEGGISVAELTGNLEKVKVSPAEAKHSSISIDETAPVIPAPQKSEDQPETAKSEPQKPAAAVRVERPDKPETKPEPAQPSDEDTRVIERVKDEPAAESEDKTATTGELEAIDQEVVVDDDADEDYEEEKLNPFAVVLLALVGIVLGAVVFKGFEILWDRFDRLVVLILALVVTGVMVGVVHALRTSRDGLSMFLATITGLVLTFGPLLVVM